MTSIKTPILFAILVFFQTAHSIEEYLTHLYDWLPIATVKIHNILDFFPVLSMREGTFALLNVIFLIFLSIVCILVFRRNRSAWKLARIVAIVETLNGLAHISAAIYAGGYFPGTASAVGLLITGPLLLRSFGERPIPHNSYI